MFQKGRTVDQVEKQIDINAEMYYQQMRIVIEHDDSINGNKQEYYDVAHKKALEIMSPIMSPKYGKKWRHDAEPPRINDKTIIY